MQLSIVIPVHNEEGNITLLHQEIRQALSGRHQYEVIYVDDHSSDRTPAILEHHGAEYPELRVIRFQRQCGQSAALRVGVQEARFPLVVTLDGDGQNDPADIERFLRLFSGQDSCLARQLVIGYRQKRQDTGWRCLSSWLANAVRRALLRDGAPDSGCGIKAFPRDFFLELPAFHHMHRFLPALVRQHGGKVYSLAVHHRDRSSGFSHYGTLDRLAEGIIDLFGVAWLGRRAMTPEIETEGQFHG
ncbi:MAG TPA: glycosyltransferase family 2 protein [Desulfobacteraceae bacterium]|nr:glycosyltransferase family 2 protein [Desulfobacteraceae bacterium]